MGIILYLLTLLLLNNCKIISFSYQSGTLSFDQYNTIMETQTQHINCPITIYSLIKIQTQSYFSLEITYERLTEQPTDKLKFTVQVGGVDRFALTLQYVVLENMPHMQVTRVNLTWSKPSKIHHSKKNITFNQNTFLSSHLAGFSSSKYTQDRFFYAIKGSQTYHFYTTVNLTTGHWISLYIIILQPFYSKNDILCFGNFIETQTEISDGNLNIKIEIQQGLRFLFGIEAIYEFQVQFQFMLPGEIIQFNGTYSYSIVVLNTSCVMTESSLPNLSAKATIYLTLMIVFLVLSVLIFIVFVVHCMCVHKNQSSFDLLQIEIDVLIRTQDQQKMLELKDVGSIFAGQTPCQYICNRNSLFQNSEKIR